MPLGKTADIAAMAIPLGHFFGRIGCFFAGCCYGRTCDLPWAVSFHHHQSLAPLDTLLHPTQLYSAAANLFIFSILFAARGHKRFDGQLFWMYMLIYGIVRSLIETLRGDDRGGYLLGQLSISQTIGFSLAAVSFLVLVILNRRYRKTA